MTATLPRGGGARGRGAACGAWLCFIFFLGGPSLLADAPAWQQALTPVVPGAFPPPRPYRATYRFGWSGFTAAFATVALSRPKDGALRLDVEGKTVGFVRTLYRLDAKHTALANAVTLLPIRATQTEVYRPKTIETRMEFTDHDVMRYRSVTPGAQV